MSMSDFAGWVLVVALAPPLLVLFGAGYIGLWRVTVGAVWANLREERERRATELETAREVFGSGAADGEGE